MNRCACLTTIRGSASSIQVLATTRSPQIIGLDQARALIRSAEAELVDCEREIDSAAVMNLVAASACSAYDCEFVALARQMGIPLVTEDTGLLRAFPDVAIGMTVALERP